MYSLLNEFQEMTDMKVTITCLVHAGLFTFFFPGGTSSVRRLNIHILLTLNTFSSETFTMSEKSILMFITQVA